MYTIKRSSTKAQNLGLARAGILKTPGFCLSCHLGPRSGASTKMQQWSNDFKVCQMEWIRVLRARTKRKMRIKRTVFTMRVIRTILPEHIIMLQYPASFPVVVAPKMNQQELILFFLVALLVRYFILQKLVSALSTAGTETYIYIYTYPPIMRPLQQGLLPRSPMHSSWLFREGSPESFQAGKAPEALQASLISLGRRGRGAVEAQTPMQ